MNDVAFAETTLNGILDAASAALYAEDYDTVVRLTTQALEHEPQCQKALTMRGAAELRRFQYFPSIIDYDRLLQINPKSFVGLNNRAQSYIALDMVDEAVADMTKAIKLYPDRFEPHLQLGVMYYYMGDPVTAEVYLREAARLGPSYPVCWVSLALVLKGFGKWSEALELEKRFRKRSYLLDYWDGQDLNGKHLFLFTEDGQGDRIMFLRFINTLLEKYPNVKLSVGAPDNFKRIVASSFPVAVVDEAEADYCCSLSDMPMMFGSTWQSLPRPDHYLMAEPLAIDLPSGFNVGICWISATREGKVKFIEDQPLEILVSVPNVNFFSLQYPQRECRYGIRSIPGYPSADWADTAALIAKLDLVISVDTAVAHMAGALGKPVWTIVRHSPSWPWLLAEMLPSPSYAVWYPSMRLFRQEAKANMTAPINRVILELRRLVA